MKLARLRALLLTVWIGSLWTIGYVVAPTLFGTIPDRALAGTIAGSMFRVEAWLSLFCGVALLIIAAWSKGELDGRQRKLVLGLIVAMLLCTLIGYFGLQPFMAALKESIGAGDVAVSAVKTQFARLHGLASGIYLLQSLLGVLLLFRFR
jgi:hypothetical protein